MTYSAAIAYLYSLQKHGIKLGLETMAALMARLDSPHRRFRALHIAGTNGKGSTAAMTAAVLQAGGFRVGLYTSPHLVDFRERIRVNGTMIDEGCVSHLTQQIRDVCRQDLSPTFFECTTAMAFQYFADSSIDVAVVEVGLGGRFDATNIVQPAACAITTIALDHQEYLGKTLASIAAEKAGIIKSRIPVVVGRLDEEAEQGYIAALREADVGLVALAGFMRVLKAPLLNAFAGRIINIHPSLLPSFPGLEAWKQALAHGVKVTGCTVHYVDAGVDSGPIIGQQTVPVLDDDTPETLHQRIQVAEHTLYPQCVAGLARGELAVQGRRVLRRST